MKKVERVTPSEIAAERGEQSINTIPKSDLSRKKDQSLGYYINQLKDSEIKKFFEPLGYITHTLVNSDLHQVAGPYYIVVCNDYIIFFNDYSTKVNSIEETTEGQLWDNIDNLNPDQLLKKYAEITNTSVGKMISDSIAVNLFGKRFRESYNQKKKTFDENNLKVAFYDLTPDQRKFFKDAKEIQEADIISRYNMNAYGMANIENKIKND